MDCPRCGTEMQVYLPGDDPVYKCPNCNLKGTKSQLEAVDK